MLDDSTAGDAWRPSPSTTKPRGPGYAIFGEELTGLRPLHRLVRQRLGHQPECCLPVTAFRAFVRRTRSYQRNIDSDRRYLKSVPLPSPSRRRGAITFPFAFTQIPAPVERYADKLQARKRLSASSAGSTATARTSAIAVPEPAPPEAPFMPIFRSPRSEPQH